MTDKILLSRQEASAALGVSTRTLDYLLARGKISSRRIGKRRLIPRTEVERFARHDHPSPPSRQANGHS
ncbi:MAG: excisionase [Acidobacteria bacterium]|nr:MAG: excisionase [Acidobacteriota bacterium]